MSWAYYSAEVIPQATISSNQKLSFGRSIAYSVDYARRLSSGNTALLLEFPVAAAPSHRVGERPTQRHHEPRNVICDAFVASSLCESCARIAVAIRRLQIRTLRRK